MPHSKHHNPKLEMAHTWSWECVRQRGNRLDRYRQRINFHVAEEHKPTGISMKARIRDTRARWAAIDEFYIPPDPKYNKPPTPHEIRAEAARRREGGKGDADSELLPELDNDPRELIIEGEREEDEEVETVQGVVDEVSAERRRHEVSLLDLPRGRIHRKEKKSTGSKVDGDFEWIGRNRRGGLDEEWELETIGEREAWDELEEFLDEDDWEALESDEENDVVKYDGRGQTVRARALTYAEKVRGKAG